MGLFLAFDLLEIAIGTGIVFLLVILAVITNLPEDWIDRLAGRPGRRR